MEIKTYKELENLIEKGHKIKFHCPNCKCDHTEDNLKLLGHMKGQRFSGIYNQLDLWSTTCTCGYKSKFLEELIIE